MVELGGGEPVQIGMDQRETPPILMDEGKCRTADRCWFGTQSVGDPSNQRRLSGSQFAEQGDDFAALEEEAQTSTQPVSLLPGAQDCFPG